MIVGSMGLFMLGLGSNEYGFLEDTLFSGRRSVCKIAW